MGEKKGIEMVALAEISQCHPSSGIIPAPGGSGCEAADVCSVGAESAGIPQRWERAQPVPPVPLPGCVWAGGEPLCPAWLISCSC